MKASLLAGFVAAASVCFLSSLIGAPASAQYGPPSSAPSPEQIGECNALGIALDKCSEEAILRTRCLGAVGAPCGGTGRPPELGPLVLSIIIGSGVALAAGSFAARRIRHVKERALG